MNPRESDTGNMSADIHQFLPVLPVLPSMMKLFFLTYFTTGAINFIGIHGNPTKSTIIKISKQVGLCGC